MYWKSIVASSAAPSSPPIDDSRGRDDFSRRRAAILRAAEVAAGHGAASPLVSAAHEAASPRIAPDVGSAVIEVDSDSMGEIDRGPRGGCLGRCFAMGGRCGGDSQVDGASTAARTGGRSWRSCAPADCRRAGAAERGADIRHARRCAGRGVRGQWADSAMCRRHAGIRGYLGRRSEHRGEAVARRPRATRRRGPAVSRCCRRQMARRRAARRLTSRAKPPSGRGGEQSGSGALEWRERYQTEVVGQGAATGACEGEDARRPRFDDPFAYAWRP